MSPTTQVSQSGRRPRGRWASNAINAGGWCLNASPSTEAYAARAHNLPKAHDTSLGKPHLIHLVQNVGHHVFDECSGGTHH